MSSFGFWIFMLIMDLLIPLTMVGFGKWFSKSSPEDINDIFGYRTTMSRKNRDTWDFAHHYFGKLWFVLGLALLPVIAIIFIMAYGGSIDSISKLGTLGLAISLVLMLVPIYFTEKALKRTFDKYGRRR